MSSEACNKYILNVPFICDIEYRDHLLATSLLPLCYWHEYLDVVFFYKANHNIFNIDEKPSISSTSGSKTDKII
jgi:hypothetical protein